MSCILDNIQPTSSDQLFRPEKPRFIRQTLTNPFMTRTVSISEAKSHLSEMVGRMMYAGDHIIIERHGKSVAAMIPIEDYAEFEKAKRERQAASGKDSRQEVFTGI